MEGVAIHWFSIVRELQPTLLWEDFKRELLNQFGGIANLSPDEQLAALQQTGSINDYINDFELIASMIPRETKELYVGYFMNGLHKEMKNRVRLMGSITHLDVFTTTRNVEVALGSKHRARNI